MADFNYIILKDGTVEITEYVGTDTDVRVPEGIDGRKVTSIGFCAFATQIHITNIIIPDGVRRIKQGAFFQCKGLTSVALPNELKYIEKEAFAECIHLQDIVLPQSLLTIGPMAFYGCTRLKRVAFTGAIFCISLYAFTFCNSLVIYAPSNAMYIQNYCKSNGIRFMPADNLFPAKPKKHKENKLNYEVIEEYGVVASNGEWKMKLRLIKWNGNWAEYDLRYWTVDETGIERYRKGVLLTKTEVEGLKKLLNNINQI